MSYGYTYTFPALRGIQAGQEYFVVMCPLKLLPKIFIFDEAPLPPELRAQRTLNLARIPEIAQYILDNRHDYAFSAITASVDGEVRFEPANMSDGTSDIGRLIVPMSAHFIINDGQHRRAAIEKALEEQPDLEDETIAVVFYVDAGLRRSQQLFADMNKHAVRPTQSLGILYDYRDPLAGLSRDLAERVFCFKGLTEMEKTTISNRSVKLFTLSGIYQATSALLDKRKNESVSEEEKELAFQFWTELGQIIPEWQSAAKRKISSAELRREYVHVHSVVLHALGLVGNALLRQHPRDWKIILSPLQKIDWRRSNASLWEGRAMIGGQMSKVRQNVLLTANFLKTTLGLASTPAEVRLEERHNQGVHASDPFLERS
jgi:DNA sulfur modification protein DndB